MSRGLQTYAGTDETPDRSHMLTYGYTFKYRLLMSHCKCDQSDKATRQYLTPEHNCSKIRVTPNGSSDSALQQLSRTAPSGHTSNILRSIWQRLPELDSITELPCIPDLMSCQHRRIQRIKLTLHTPQLG